MSTLTLTKTELTQKQVDEAINRMKKLDLHENTIKEFMVERKLNKSIPVRMGSAVVGSLFLLNEDEEAIVREIEDDYNIVVYHVIENNTDFGKLLTMLYVSSEVEEWQYDEELFDSNCQFAYVKNLDDDLCSEFGTINYAKAYGGLVRTE